MLGAIAALASSVGGVFLAFRDIQVFDCRSVSFSGTSTTCYSNDLGAVNGTVAGVGLVAIGAALFIFALIRMATIK